MARLFGFSIDPKKKDSPSVISPVPQNNEDGNDNFIASSFYGSYVDIEGVYRSEFDLIKRYREMALHPECDGAIEDVINENFNVTTARIIIRKRILIYFSEIPSL